MPFIRHCVECRKCATRYLIASSPYGNGSYIWRTPLSYSDECVLYCFCQRPPVLNDWKETDVKACVVSKAAHNRGYGTPQEIVAIEQPRVLNRRSRRREELQETS